MHDEALVTPEALAHVLMHSEGGLKNIPALARKVALLNQAETPTLKSAGHELGCLMRCAVQSVSFPECPRSVRIAAAHAIALRRKKSLSPENRLKTVYEAASGNYSGRVGQTARSLFRRLHDKLHLHGYWEAAVSLLRNLGCTVIIPKGQQCCGFPALSGGDASTFVELAAKNLDLFEKYQPDFIMTACASCGSALQELYPEVLGEKRSDLALRVGNAADKVVDAVVLLRYLGFKPENTAAVRKSVVTYHDPCHLRRRKITKEPREFLENLPGADFVEMEQPGTCCGLGGTFNVYHYGTSIAINSRKRDLIVKSGPDTLLTGCPGCMMQISDGLSQKGVGTRVLHTLQLLAEFKSK